MYTFGLDAGDRWAHRVGAGGDQQGVVDQRFAAGKHYCFCSCLRILHLGLKHMLQSAWLFSQFGSQPATAAYIDHVRAGIGLPSIWDDLKCQLYLGDDDFAQSLPQQTQGKTVDTEIPRAQRRAAAPALTRCNARPDPKSLPPIRGVHKTNNLA